MATLDELGHKYGTDKASGSHDYLRFYEPLLAPFRDRDFDFVEMGVGSGGSLKMWEEFFPKAFIIGFDIEDKRDYEGQRISTVRGDQGNIEDLDRLISHASDMAVINDDAGHNPQHQLL